MFFARTNFSTKCLLIAVLSIFCLLGAVEGKLLLFDDFWNLTLSNRKEALYNPVWEQVDAPLLTPEDDGFGNIVLKPGRISMRTGSKQWENYQVEIKFRLLPEVGDKLSHIALNVRCDDAKPKGKYTICLQVEEKTGLVFQIKNEKQEVLADRELGGSPQEVFGSGWHTFRVKVIGKALVAYLDDIEMGRILAFDLPDKGNIFLEWENKQDSLNDEIGQIAYVKVEEVQLPEESELKIEKEFMRDLWQLRTIGNNLALGKKAILSPEPNYRLTKSDSDPWDLTDGELTCKLRRDDRIWWDPKTVGWTDYPFIYIGLDLGEEKAVDRVVLRVLGGQEQKMLAFPKKIEVLLSGDGENYYRASEWQKSRPDDSAFIYLPEEGRHYVYPFSFDCGNRSARYIVFKIESAGFFFVDELAVMEGTYPACPTAVGERIPFKLESALLWSEVDKLWVCNNLPIYDRVMFADLRATSSEVELVFELPVGVELVQLYRGWNNVEEKITMQQVNLAGKLYNQYSVRVQNPKPYEDMRILLCTDWENGRKGEAFLYVKWQGGQQEKSPIPIEVYNIETIEPPKRLHTSIAWMGEQYQRNWPDFFNTYRDLGFNAVPFFPRYGIQHDWISKARENGFSILYNESPMHQMLSRYRNEEEIYVLNPDGSRGEDVSLAYRGQFYQREMERIERLAEEVRPDWIFFDLELFVLYLPIARNDQQLLARMEKEGWTSVPEACRILATEMTIDIVEASKKWVTSEEESPKVGFYNFYPPRLYGGIHDFDSLYPEYIELAQPSFYVGGDAKAIGDQVRQIRECIPRSDIIPWLTAGTYGEFSSRRMRDIILEAFFNGSCGITFYIIYDFNALDLKYTTEAIAIAKKVEDIIVDGQLIAREDLKANDLHTRVTGLKTEDGQSAILVSNYDDNEAKDIDVFYKVSTESQIIDLDDDKVVGTISPNNPSFVVQLSPAVQSKAFVILPIGK